MKFSAQTKASPDNWKDLAHVFRDAGYNVFPKKEGYEGGIRVILRGQFSFLDIYQVRDIEIYTMAFEKMLIPIWRDAGWQEMVLTPLDDGRVLICVEVNFKNILLFYLMGLLMALLTLFYYGAGDIILRFLVNGYPFLAIIILLFIGTRLLLYYLAFFFHIRKKAISFLSKMGSAS